MDIQMPGMDGYTTTQKIRSELGLSTLPVIALSAHVLAGEREKVLSCGMNDFLMKPIQHNELAIILLRYLPGFWDMQAVLGFSNGNMENFREIVHLFLRQFPLELAALRTAIHEDNLKDVVRITHNLRSTTAYAGFQESIGKTLLQLEAEARKPENLDTQLLTALYTEVVNDGRFAVAILRRETGM
jgi:CheY-like chemotaxis protein